MKRAFKKPIKRGIPELENIDEKYRDIVRLIVQKKFSNARRLAEKRAGADGEFLCEIAVLFTRLEHWDGAQYLFKRALKLSPKTASVHYNYGLFLKFKKEFKEAESEVEIAIKFDKTNPNYHSMLGSIQLINKNIKSAEESFNTALDLDPKNIFAWSGLGNIAMSKSEFERAEKIYKKIIKMDKTFVGSYINLILLYNEQGREKDAKKMIKLAEKAKLKITLDK
jgi:Tfp pilus assembly protein PilF